MARVLIVGGYGVFGSRVAERLARVAGIEVVIAGRDASRAGAFAASLRDGAQAAVQHAVLDATACNAASLTGLAPAIVVNASGPFQGQDHSLARAAIGAKVHYVDLADARAFVGGIAALDAAAKAAGVLVVSGASTVPAVSSAVVDAFAGRFSKLREVVYGISPGNSFDPGAATTASILSYVGKPFLMPWKGAPRVVHGWQGLHTHRFPEFGRRWMGHCDIPDLDLFPGRYPGLGSVRFSAGVEVGLFHLGMWGLSWLVRAGLIARPERLARPLLAAKRRLAWLGSDQGGMFMTLDGLGPDGAARRIEWHLIAMSGHGPYIPASPAVVLVKKLLAGGLHVRGAMPCQGLLTLEEFLAEVGDLDIRAFSSIEPLYRRVLGRAFDHLPGRVRELHDLESASRWAGRAEVERGRSLPARLIGNFAGLPASGNDVPVTVTFQAQGGAEFWSRDFAGRIFRSVQSGDGRTVREAIGPIGLSMRPFVTPEGLSLEITGMRILGVPAPRALWPKVATREWEEGGRYHFSVEAGMPLLGRLVRYAGWLEPMPNDDAARGGERV